MNNYLIIKESGRFFTLITREIIFDDNIFEIITTDLNPNKETDIWNGSMWLDVDFLIIPQELSRMKFKKQIRRSTIYTYEIILEYIKNMTITETFTEDMKLDIIDDIENCVTFERYNPKFIMLANMLNVSDEIKDEIFIEGNKID